MSNARPPAMSDPRTRPPVRGGRRLVEVLLVIFLLVLGTAVLMPTLQGIKSSAQKEYMGSRGAPANDALAQMILPTSPEAGTTRDGDAARTAISQAQVKSFVATIDLTPGLSVGTAQPESIYEAAFSAKLEALNPSAAKGLCEIQLPLPPQLISLSDLTVALSGDPSDNVFVRLRDLLARIMGIVSVGKQGDHRTAAAFCDHIGEKAEGSPQVGARRRPHGAAYQIRRNARRASTVVERLLGAALREHGPNPGRGNGTAP